MIRRTTASGCETYTAWLPATSATVAPAFDFPEVRPAATTLRFRWGTVVVPLEITVGSVSRP
jgi:hypothetical protein